MDHAATADLPILIGAALLLLSLFASKLGGRLGIPALLLFLFIGMLAGSEGPGGIDFENYRVTQNVGVVTLAFILFSGGLETNWQHTRPVLKMGLSLATLGVLLTTGMVGTVAHFLLHLNWPTSLLLGAVVSSTDASAIFSVLREHSLGLRGHIKPLLEFESGVNDPMAVFLVVGLTELLSNPGQAWYTIIPLFLKQMVIGGVLGLLLGRVAVRLMNSINLAFDGLYSVLSVALVGLIYGLSAVLGGSGFLAVYIAGVVLGNSNFIHKRTLRLWHDGLTYLLEIGMFLVLGLLVFPSALLRVALPALAVSLFLMFVARPVATYVSLAFSPMKKRGKSMVAWVGLRGAVPIILTTFPLLAHVPNAQIIFNVAFFIVLTSILIQGTTLPLVARWLRVDAEAQDTPVKPLLYTPSGTGRTNLTEIVVPEGSVVAGRRIVDLAFPLDVLFVLIYRGDEHVVPRGSTRLQAGDAVQVLGPQPIIEEVQARVGQTA
ncbi:potassium/proton antiporter [Deinococcus ruber]|uniref:K+/H+ antiporter n=1 Tax=Deinococcus ruber TaxID=1848197 RepID=A0A918F1I0_9DEIO|nr:potassium/proton antiporter [Deinococcus ruber]GGQ92987.1 K+/H+ antiporter [Deinococcus ruber]